MAGSSARVLISTSGASGSRSRARPVPIIDTTLDQENAQPFAQRIGEDRSGKGRSV